MSRSEYDAHASLKAGARVTPNPPAPAKPALRLVTVLKFTAAAVVLILAAYHGVQWYG